MRGEHDGAVGFVAWRDHDELACTETGVALQAMGVVPAQVVRRCADEVDEELAGASPAFGVGALRPTDDTHLQAVPDGGVGRRRCAG
jgi:hypothetical protein